MTSQKHSRSTDPPAPPWPTRHHSSPLAHHAPVASDHEPCFASPLFSCTLTACSTSLHVALRTDGYASNHLGAPRGRWATRVVWCRRWAPFTIDRRTYCLVPCSRFAHADQPSQPKRIANHSNHRHRWMVISMYVSPHTHASHTRPPAHAPHDSCRLRSTADQAIHQRHPGPHVTMHPLSLTMPRSPRIMSRASPLLSCPAH